MRPPPFHCTARVEPWRARPVPFWRHGLRPPPATSLRVLVLCVPRRAFAIWRTYAWCIKSTLIGASKTAAGSSTCFTFLPSMSKTSTFIAFILQSKRLLLARLFNHDQAAFRSGDRSVYTEHIAFSIYKDYLKSGYGHALIAHMASST